MAGGKLAGKGEIEAGAVETKIIWVKTAYTAGRKCLRNRRIANEIEPRKPEGRDTLTVPGLEKCWGEARTPETKNR